MERMKTMENLKVESLVKKASKGNKEAFEEIVRLKLKTIMLSSMNILKQRQDAEDATQDIVLKMYKNIGNLKEPAAFNSWMHRIILNHCYNLHGSKQRKQENTGMDEHLLKIEEEDREFLPQVYAEDKDRSLMLREIISSLPEQRRLIISMFYYDEMSYTEIAKALDIPINTVGSNLKRAKEQIKTEIEKNETINVNDINKFAGIPVLTQVLEAQAHELMPQATIDNIMAFTHKSILADSAIKKMGLLTWKKMCTAVVCTILVTGGVVYACDGYNPNANTGSNATTTKNAISQQEQHNPGGEILFASGDCNCGHANPKEMTLTDIEEDYESINWIIVNKDTQLTYEGQGSSITDDLKRLYTEKLDGNYTVTFTVKYLHGKSSLERDFLIYTGSEPPADYDNYTE